MIRNPLSPKLSKPSVRGTSTGRDGTYFAERNNPDDALRLSRHAVLEPKGR